MSKRVAIMQPYLFPYIGYFQLMNAVDEFVVYDNIEYTKKGWINRNRLLKDGIDYWFTLPLARASDYLNIDERELASQWPKERNKILNKISDSYLKAPQFDKIFPLISRILMFEETNLFRFLFNSILQIKNFLGIPCELLISSRINANHNLKSESKVISICKVLGANQYINPIGGIRLYNTENFLKENIKLNFICADPIIYRQFNDDFVAWLSIIDVMMFNEISQIKYFLQSYKLQ